MTGTRRTGAAIAALTARAFRPGASDGVDRALRTNVLPLLRAEGTTGP